MIIVLMALLSLCAISFTYLLYEKKLKIGAIAVAILYFNIVAWTYLVFFVDVANLGFKESRSADLIGSVVFHSFSDFKELTSMMPTELHIATAFVAILVALIIILELIISSIRIYHAIINNRKRIRVSINKVVLRFKAIPRETRSVRRIFLLHCRLNN